MVGLVILLNLLVDLLYSIADPKLRADVLQRKVKFEKNAK